MNSLQKSPNLHTDSEKDSSKYCTECGAKLTADDRGIYMKLVTRTAQTFLCMSCLAPRLKTDSDNLRKLADYYRASGECTLFR